MITIRDQIDHENKHASITAGEYYFKQDKLRDADRGDEVDAVRNIMKKRIQDVAGTIKTLSSRKGGIGGKYNSLLTDIATFDGEVDFNMLAYFGLQSIFMQIGKDGTADWGSTAMAMAGRLEFEHKTHKFENENPGYYHVLMTSMESQQVSSYKHIRNTLSKKMTDFDMEWNDWDINTKVQVANKILISIMHNLPDVLFRGMRYSNGKSTATIQTTPDADDWLAEFEAERGFLNPIRMPTLIKPLDWIHNSETGHIRGGYYSHRLSRDLVKTWTQAHRDYLRPFKMEQHLKAINKLQDTEWTINQRVLQVQSDMFTGDPKKQTEFPGIPMRERSVPVTADKSLEGVDKSDMTEAQLALLDDYKVMAKAAGRKDRTRVGQLVSFTRAFRMANQYKDMDKFHFVYTPDFRGRIYAETSGLQPQGNDSSKALLQFANSKPVTERGLYWLAVHGANTFGIDKVSNDDRVQWVKDNERELRQIAGDPLAFGSLWKDADKPWQYLAFVFAWADTDFGKNPLAPTSLPIGLDGSCNGLQHYSALLRDNIGGRSVNLIDSELPADIYQDVSDVLGTKLQSRTGDSLAAKWLASGLGRKLAKRPVMTLPYGSTQTSCRDYIHDWALDNRHLFPFTDEVEIYDLVKYLTPLLWESIGEVVIAARTGMAWLQQNASKSSREGEEVITWTSPAGFPVYQPYVEQDQVMVQTKTSGGLLLERIRVSINKDTDEVAYTKQRSGIAPNFVHSLDSSHMVMVINATDLTDYAMIHDDFGTHACDTEYLWGVIREQFVFMYTKHQPLFDWCQQQPGVDSTTIPDMGDLDIHEVLTSQYFFG